MADPGEECDSVAGCTECELDIHICNPLNNVPCGDSQKCSWTLLTEDPFEAYFTCQPISEDPLENDQGDCFDGNDAADWQCDLGLACYRATFLEGCDVAGGCCAEYCNTQLGSEQCSGVGDECEPEPDLALGLPTLGVCR